MLTFNECQVLCLLAAVVQRHVVELECGKADYMEIYMKTEIDGIRPPDHPDSIQIIKKMDEPWGFILRGTSEGIKDAQSKLKNYASEIRVDRFEIDKRGMSQFLASPEGQREISAIESKNRVVINPAPSGSGGRVGQKDAGNTIGQH